MNNNEIYTLGYENSDFNTFASTLKDENIKILIDIRYYPKSRKKGFSKNEMIKYFSNNGIKYIHLKKLGSPPEIRKKLRKDKNYNSFFKKYKKYLEKQNEELNFLVNILKNDKTCIFCYEEDFRFCHRKTVASYLNLVNDEEINIIHL